MADDTSRSTTTTPSATGTPFTATLDPGAVEDRGDVQTIAARAAAAVPGVHALGSPAGRAAVRAMGRIAGARTVYGPGVSVEVGDRATAIDISLSVEYGTAIADLAREVRRSVTAAVTDTTRLDVTEVNVTVTGLHHPDDDVVLTEDPDDVVLTEDPDAVVLTEGPDAVATPVDAPAAAAKPDVDPTPEAPVTQASTGSSVESGEAKIVVADQVVVTDRVVIVRDSHSDSDGDAESDDATDPTAR